MMRICCLLLFAFCVSCLPMQAQSSYEDYTESQKEYIYNNTFGSANDWQIPDEWKAVLRIANHELILHPKTGDTAYRNYEAVYFDQEIDIDQGRDFEIEAVFNFPVLQAHEKLVFFWGADLNADAGYGDCLDYTAEQVSVHPFTGMFVPIQPVSVIKKEILVYNWQHADRFLIRKVKNKLYIFYNEQLVDTKDFTAFKGKQVGIAANGAYLSGGSGTMDVRSIRVCYLNAPAQVAVNTPPVITITQPHLDRNLMLVPPKPYTVKGNAKDADGIAEVRINDKIASLDAEGNFYGDVALQPGSNTITVTASDKKGQWARRSFELRSGPNVAAPAGQESRIALVVGNANYTQIRSLANPLHDADSIAKRLESMGFTVLECKDCNRSQLLDKIEEFGSKLQNNSVAFFFYAGHGMQINGRNYLIPVDARMQHKNDAEYECVDIGRLMGQMEDAHAKVNIVVLDACRDNPFERSWYRSTATEGFSSITSGPRGSIIEFSTSPSHTAADGDGANSLYTASLLQVLGTPGLNLPALFQRVRAKVVSQSNGEQVPWELNLLLDDYYLVK